MKNQPRFKHYFLFFIIFIFGVNFSFAQSEDAVEEQNQSQNASELDLERVLAERLEDMLQPLVGPTVVIVDLELYSSPPELKGFKYSTSESLPGLPVSVSESANSEDLLKSEVVQISIRIFVSETMPDADVDRITELIPLWINLNYQRGDQILVEPVPFVNPPMTMVQFLYSWRVVGFIAVGFLLILIVVFVLFALFGPKPSANVKSSVTGGVPSGIGGPISAQSIAQLLDTKIGSKSEESSEESAKSVGAISSNILTLPDEAVAVKIIRDDQNKKLFGSLSALSEMKAVSLKQLLDDEPAILIAFALRLANSNAVADFLQEQPENIRVEIFNAWNQIINLEPEAVKEISERIRSKIEKTGKLVANLPDAVDKLAEVLNYSPDNLAFKLFKDIQESNNNLASKLEPKIFFIEDLDSLDTVTLRRIAMSIPKEILATVLYESPEHIREKLYSSISHRMADILREEVSMINGVSNEMAIKAKSILMLSLKQIQSSANR